MLTQNQQRRLEQIESKYSTANGATDAEWHEAKTILATAIIGSRVFVTCRDWWGTITRIVSIETNQQGSILYVMENGQMLTANEFDIHK